MTTNLAISVGVCGESTLLVGDEHTASRVGSGLIGVLATPVMINVIEAAALACCEALLPEGHQSLGTHLNISHIAATPVGMRIVARATVTHVEGRKISFAIQVHDQRDLIGVIAVGKCGHHRNGQYAVTFLFIHVLSLQMVADQT